MILRLEGLGEVGGYGTAKWRVSVAAEHIGLETSALKVWIWITDIYIYIGGN